PWNVYSTLNICACRLHGRRIGDNNVKKTKFAVRRKRFGMFGTSSGVRGSGAKARRKDFSTGQLAKHRRFTHHRRASSGDRTDGSPRHTTRISKLLKARARERWGLASTVG